MSLFSRLFGKSAPSAPEPVMHQGFVIFPEPSKEPGGYRVGARIEKEIGGELKTHMMIRADTYSAQDTAIEASITKAKMFIDQVGDGVFADRG